MQEQIALNMGRKCRFCSEVFLVDATMHNEPDVFKLNICQLDRFFRQLEC